LITFGEIQDYEQILESNITLEDFTVGAKQKRALREYLGLKPEENNVLVMIKL